MCMHIKALCDKNTENKALATHMFNIKQLKQQKSMIIIAWPVVLTCFILNIASKFVIEMLVTVKICLFKTYYDWSLNVMLSLFKPVLFNYIFYWLFKTCSVIVNKYKQKIAVVYSYFSIINDLIIWLEFASCDIP